MKILIKGLLILLSLAVIVNVLIYSGFTGNEALLGSKSQTLKGSWLYMLMFYFHVFFGGIALVTGTTQIIFTLTKRKAHRIVGKIYVIGVLLSGLAGSYIAIYADTGLVTQTGFFMLGILWLTTTYFAFMTIRKGLKKQHRQWVTRSMALTLAAVTLRVWTSSFLISGFEFAIVYPIIAWLCWVPNILIAEFVLLLNRKFALA